jgi:SAM-dependent methyltransferase
MFDVEVNSGAKRQVTYAPAMEAIQVVLVLPSPPVPPGWAESWQRSWDRLEEDLVSDRELRLRVLLDVVEAMAGTGPTVVDLACGPGTITRRLLGRLPRARSIAVDVDPVLLTIASATFADDDRVRIVRADLNDPTWVDGLPESQVDAVLTATALHWLPEDAVRRLYGDLADLVRPGGIVAHSEQMPLGELPRLGPALAEIDRQRRTGGDDGRARWGAWWERASRDPALQSAMAQRQVVFETSYPIEEFSPPADWHLAALREAGFTEAGVVWRSGASAVVAAVR